MTTNDQVNARSAGRCRLAALGLVLAASLCATFAHAQGRSSALGVSAVVVRRCAVNTQSLVVAGTSDGNLVLTCSHEGQVAVQFIEGLARTPATETSTLGVQTLVQVNAQQGVSSEVDQAALRDAQAVAAAASAGTAARTMTVTLMF